MKSAVGCDQSLTLNCICTANQVMAEHRASCKTANALYVLV